MLHRFATGLVQSLLDGLNKELARYLDKEAIEEIHQAFLFAEVAHRGQKRLSGESYITHPVAVATIVAQMHMDEQSIKAALLHDVLEDTEVNKPQMEAKFGTQVADLVDGLSKLTQINFGTVAEAQAENFRKMVLAMTRDIRVIIIKLADRLHNMRTLGSMPANKQRRKARETLEIYAPIANRLGMHNIRIELEDLCFRALYPERARILSDAVKKLHGNRKKIIHVMESDIIKCLKRHGISSCQVLGRQKHLYGIYKKMRTKHLTFSDVTDVYAFRIIVERTDSCYLVLGAIHNLYKPVPQRFKDYIAIPKANGYQSLHTTLFGPYGVPIEVQIRTKDMNHLAENGIAAHWLYKSSENVASDAQLRAHEWVKSLLEMQQSTGSSIEFIENVKIDLFPDEVYVFTPKGDILELPHGATAVDFAYAVHTDVGNSCVAAKIDRRLVPLSTQLSNGQTLEVICAPGAKPNPAWLNYVVTGKARSSIRHFLKSHKRTEAQELGLALLEKAAQDQGYLIKKISKKQLNQVLLEHNVKNPQDLYEKIGLGHLHAMAIAEQLRPQKIKTSKTLDTQQPLSIKGTQGMVIQFAECCRPIPGDPIYGLISTGEGIVIHHEQCKNLQKNLSSSTEEGLPVQWEETLEREFPVDICVDLADQRNALAQLTAAISQSEANIDDIHVETRVGKYSTVSLQLSVRDRDHLAHVMQRLRRISDILKVWRVRNKKGE